MDALGVITRFAKHSPARFFPGDGWCCHFCGARCGERGMPSRFDEKHATDCVWWNAVELEQTVARYCHKKRGSTYAVLAEAQVQASQPIVEGDIVVVYIADSDGTPWVRPTTEFHDGRFELIAKS